MNLLKQEVSKAAPYNAVISAIAAGASQHNEIAAKAGIESSALDYYLKELVRLGLVQREEPLAGKRGRKCLWQLTDNLFKFWYRFVRPRQALVERGLGARVAERIELGLPEYMGPVFETICRDWLWRELEVNALDFEIPDIGRWWGNDPVHKRQAEIDIMGEQDKNTALFAECKWTNEKVDLGVLETLIERSNLFAYQKKHFFLFSKSGFTKGCIEKAKQLGNATLKTYADMIHDKGD